MTRFDNSIVLFLQKKKFNRTFKNQRIFHSIIKKNLAKVIFIYLSINYP